MAEAEVAAVVGGSLLASSGYFSFHPSSPPGAASSTLCCAAADCRPGQGKAGRAGHTRRGTQNASRSEVTSRLACARHQAQAPVLPHRKVVWITAGIHPCRSSRVPAPALEPALPPPAPAPLAPLEKAPPAATAPAAGCAVPMAYLRLQRCGHAQQQHGTGTPPQCAASEDPGLSPNAQPQIFPRRGHSRCALVGPVPRGERTAGSYAGRGASGGEGGLGPRAGGRPSAACGAAGPWPAELAQRRDSG